MPPQTLSELLHKISWAVSFSLGFVVTFFLGMLVDGFYYGGFFLIALGTLLFGMAAKGMFFPKEKIVKTVEQYLSSEKEPQKCRTQESAIEEETPTTSLEEEIPESVFVREEKKGEEEVSENEQRRLKSEEVAEHQQRRLKTIPEEEDATPKEPGFLQKFFAENLLAKIGGILLFLGVLFLLQLVYTQIGPVGKLLIGFLIGFGIYGVGVFLDKKKYIDESRALLGTGILINYLVILSGRFLIGDTLSSSTFLSEGLTFFLLIGNTIFAVVTSLLYRSHALLFFSFVFAYLNPFLVAAEVSDSPYTLIGYAAIVSLGAMALSVFLKKDLEGYAKGLLITAFFGGNTLFLLAPFDTEGEWLIKLGSIAILSLLTIYTSYKTQEGKYLSLFFTGAYVYLLFLIFGGNLFLGDVFYSGTIFLACVLHLFLFLLAGAALILLTSSVSLFSLLIFPLIILMALILGGNTNIISFIMPTLVGTMIAYLGVFAVIGNRVGSILQHLFFSALGLFVLFVSGLSVMLMMFENMPLSQAYGIIIATFLFLWSAYFFAVRNKLTYLYFIGTLMSIIMLLPILLQGREGELAAVSVGSIVALIISNIFWPFLQDKIHANQMRNLILGLIMGVLFGAGEIFYFGLAYFPGVQTGVAFLGFAILYFFLGYFMLQKLSVSFQTSPEDSHTQASEISEAKESAKNVVYSLLGISISLFSLAIAFVFSKHGEVISAVWLFEASLMFFFYQRTKDTKVYAAGIILMGVGLSRLIPLLGSIEQEEFLALIPLSIIMGSLVVNLKFLEWEERSRRILHDMGHLIGAGLIGLLLIQIIPTHGHGLSILSISAFSAILALVYSNIYCGIIRQAFVAVMIFFFLYHIERLEYVFEKLDRDNLAHWKPLQYLSTTLFAAGYYLFTRFSPASIWKNILTIAFAAYAFIISTQFVYYFFHENVFVITIYWGLLATALLGYGIQKDVIKYRTLGLYILTLTVLKIVIYDVWQVEDTVMRIISLMLVGIVMIAISILYTKKYGKNPQGELDWKNLMKE